MMCVLYKLLAIYLSKIAILLFGMCDNTVLLHLCLKERQIFDRSEEFISRNLQNYRSAAAEEIVYGVVHFTSLSPNYEQCPIADCTKKLKNLAHRRLPDNMTIKPFICLSHN